jgi:hypothetical protein
MQIKTLGDESPSYQERREELRLAELAMTEHIEEWRRCDACSRMVRRFVTLLSPVWNLLDLTPQGRRDWYAELSYR